MPRVRQLFSEVAADCGPAALAFVAAHYGVRISIPHIRRVAGTSGQGTDMEALRQAAISIGFESNIGRVTRENFFRIDLPAICHMGSLLNGHYVVLRERTSKDVTLADPVQGSLQLSLDSFFGAWSGHVIVLRPTNALIANGSVTLGVLREVLTYRRSVVVIVCGLVIQVAAALVVVGASVQLATNPHEWLWSFCILLSACLVGVWAIVITEKAGLTIAHALGQRFTKATVQNTLYESLEYTDSRLSAIGSSPAEPSVVVEQLVEISRWLADCARLAMLGAIVCLLEWRLGIATIIAVAIACVVNVSVCCATSYSPWARAEAEVRKATGRLRHAVLAAQFTRGMADPEKVARQVLAIHRGANDAVTATIWGHVKTAAIVRLSCAVALCGGLAWSAAAGEPASRSDNTIVGIIMAVFAVLTTVHLSSVAPRLAPSNDWLSLEHHASDDNGGSVEPAPPMSQWALECTNLSYRDSSGAIRLPHVEFRVMHHEVVGIVGASGSGKSTLANLMVGLYSPTTGFVLLNGSDMSPSHFGGVGRGIMLLSEEAYLGTGSVRDHIIGKRSCDEEALSRVERLLDLDQLIADLPLGYDSEVGAGGRLLSRTQREVVLIARALVQNPSILVWDYGLRGGNATRERGLLSAVIRERRGRGGTTIILADGEPFGGFVDRTIQLPRRTLTGSGRSS